MNASLRVVLVCLLALLALQPAVASQTLEPVKAFRLHSDASLPPGSDAPWMPVVLPENRGSRRLTSKEPAVWYRIEFDVPREPFAGGTWAVYVPYLLDGGRFFLNGKPFAHIAEPSDTVHVKWERPHLLPVPDDALQPGRNVLTVRTQPTLASISLEFPRVALGPEVELLPYYGRRLFWVRELPQFTSVICVVVASFVLFIWMRRRSEALYGLFGLTLLAWGIRNLTFVIEVLPPTEWVIWRFFYHSASGGFVAAIALFALRFAEIRQRWLERVIFAYWLIGPVAYLLSGGAADAWLDRPWKAGLALMPVVMLVAALLAAWRQRSTRAYAMLVGIGITFLCGYHDYLQFSGPLATLLPDWAGHRVFLMHHGANAMLVVMGGILAQRFIATLSELETLNQTLEARVAEREALLETNFQRLTVLERERATVDERGRIMQDMHDGLGSQLFTSLSRTERGALTQTEMSEMLRACIAELRLALEALAPGDDNFFVALADFRYRWEALLTAAGIRSSWHVDAADEPLKLSPNVTLQVLRILQEALTNALKHARASHVQVRVTRNEGKLRVEVEDDGVGLAEADNPVGHGLRNMRTRARRLGAALKLDSRSGGTSLALELGDLAPAP